MLSLIRKGVRMWRNMGMRYMLFRIRHLVLSRSGLLKRRFPSAPPVAQYPTLAQWRATAAPFFFQSKAHIQILRSPSPALALKAERIMDGWITLFSAREVYLGENYDWLTNPDNGYRYDINQHWTQINDFSEAAGDIKFVWEKSRFSFLLPVIRYDYHFDKDCSEWVFSEIESWIAANPLNMGPNYKCSQEISLRMFHWLLALYYYRDAPALTDELFASIIQCIHGQTDHVWQNIDFSRIAVRNNHAVSETLALYSIGLLFPFLPNAPRWKQKGKAWLEEELCYQIYNDGTFIQYSHNYHRVLVQLLTWAFGLSDANGEQFSGEVYEKAAKTLAYLYQVQVAENGQLPNYGANDGALFFQCSESDFRDYRPQMNALHYFFTRKHLYDGDFGEDFQWFTQYGVQRAPRELGLSRRELAAFPDGGIYVIREGNTLSFIKCAAYKDRPSQADNLHIDVWCGGVNVLFDAGTFKYNTDETTVRYFFGTEGHNTLMVEQQDQMKKGPRFIWWNWTKEATASLTETEEYLEFSGEITAFLSKNNQSMRHRRLVRKQKQQLLWEITDTVDGSNGALIRQLWHVLPGEEKTVALASESPKIVKEGWYSSHYGVKVPALQVEIQEMSDCIYTRLELP